MNGDYDMISVIPSGRPSPLPTNIIQVYTRQLQTYPDAEAVFVYLFEQEKFAFWLDSSYVEPGLSRFSFMGAATGPLSQVVQYRATTHDIKILRDDQVYTQTMDIFDYLDQEISRMSCLTPQIPFDFNCGFVGYFGYELKNSSELKGVHQSDHPDAAFLFADQVIVFDHLAKCMYLVCCVSKGQSAQAELWFDEMERTLKLLYYPKPILNGNDPGLVVFQLCRNYEEYQSDIQECKNHLESGDSYEICLTNRLETKTVAHPLTLYRNLRWINAAPYAAFLHLDDLNVVCSSPERFLKIDRDRKVEAKPIKGTVARDNDPLEDQNRRNFLGASEKNRAENLMIVDLLRNDLGLVCKIGSISVPKLMQVETYATVHQLVSTICGELRDDIKVIDCIRSAFPGGSMTGAPKLRTMQIIDSLEKNARGIYSGTLGFLGLNGTCDLNIVIRTIVMTSTSSTIGTGGAITVQSDPADEFDEIVVKAKALIHALTLTACGSFSSNKYTIIGDNLSEGL